MSYTEGVLLEIWSYSGPTAKLIIDLNCKKWQNKQIYDF